MTRPPPPPISEDRLRPLRAERQSLRRLVSFAVDLAAFAFLFGAALLLT